MGRRIVLLVAAAVIAALGTVLVYTYAKNADDRALADQNPVTVLVAKNEIPAGTPVTEAVENGDLEQKEVPRATAIDGAMTTVEPIKEQVALTTIFPNQQLSTQMFGKTLAAEQTLPIPSGNIAVSFQFTDPARVAGFVKPGSQVVVFLTIASESQQEATRVLLPKALVIGVGRTTTAPQPATDGTSGSSSDVAANQEQIPRALLTLALTDQEAAKLVYGSQHGTLYLGLLNDKSKVSDRLSVSAQNLFG